MPAPKTSRRIVKRASSGAPRAVDRRTAKRRAAVQTAASADSLLVAAFAEALGERVAAKPKRTSRRSLSQALDQAAPGDVIGVMPGVRIAASDAYLDTERPRQRVTLSGNGYRDAFLRTASSWAIALVVSAGIVSAAAYGIASRAPARTIQTIAAASAAQL